MNQPASKEPSMDEILSSIRQIIADDDPADDATAPATEPAEPSELTADEVAVSQDLNAELEEQIPSQPAEQMVAEIAEAPAEIEALDDADAPLALSLDQMVEPPKVSEETAGIVDEPEPVNLEVESFDAPEAVEELSEPEGISGVTSAEAEAELEAAEAFEPVEEDIVRAAPDPSEFSEDFENNVSEDVNMVVPDDIAFVSEEDADEEGISLEEAASEVNFADLDAAAEMEYEPEASVVESPLPDPHLTEEMTEQLLEPTTQAAASSAFSQLDTLALSSDGRTVEDLIRELLRPMLKGWLDENLPGVVEKLVQREIERVSRGKRQ